jgi:hypothetical protein
MPSSGRGTEKRRPSDYPNRLVQAGERNAEANTVELGEAVAWCLELEWLGIQVVQELYRRRKS